MTDEELDAPDEVYDTMMEVQRNPTGAWHAIHDQADTITTLRAQLAEAQRLMRLERTIADKNADRADRAEAALAAQIEADAGLCGQNEMAIPMDHTKRTLGGLYCADAWCGEGKHAGHGYADLIRNQPHDRTALDRHDAKTREKALREAADELRGQGYGNAVRTILALIEKPNAR